MVFFRGKRWINGPEPVMRIEELKGAEKAQYPEERAKKEGINRNLEGKRSLSVTIGKERRAGKGHANGGRTTGKGRERGSWSREVARGRRD